jgi:3-oxoacyl-[acyl-carrier protein] reductase
MNLHITNQRFIVLGASSGFGKAIAEALLHEGAKVIAVARRKEVLVSMKTKYPLLETLAIDITDHNALPLLLEAIENRQIHGVVVNAGGPPAMQVLESKLRDWDAAYQSLLRWKVALVQMLIPQMTKLGYGRMVFIESASVKQPMENLVLSNAFRVAVVNMVKTLSQEIAGSGVTLNVLAPGSHETDALERVFKKKSEQTGLSVEEVRRQAIASSPMKELGAAQDFASLALWLLSPQSRFVTGQTLSVDGGTVKGIFG